MHLSHRINGALAILAGFLVTPAAFAHVSEQGIVLLLPTDFYIFSGCFAVIASMLLVSLLPHDRVFALFRPIAVRLPTLAIFDQPLLRDATSLISLTILVALCVIGVAGVRDPLVNLLPLTIWTFWWIAVFMAHALVGNLWLWINPWTGLYNRLLGDEKPLLPLPKVLGWWPAIITYVAFYLFIIADLAPNDPARLAQVVFVYLVVTFVGMVIFGKQAWLQRVECFSVLFGFIGQLACFKRAPSGRGYWLGLPGWQAISGTPLAPTKACFLLTVLASGSFDGVNETFWWLVQIGVNPLAFPGRSAVFWQSVLGVIGANVVLYALFIGCIWLASRLVNLTAAKNAKRSDFWAAFSALAISILPIAVVYHGSHYLVAFMVNGQYLLAALADPLAQGSNYFGLKTYPVTTGFLNYMPTVRLIWLSQATFVVLGHITAVLMAHYAIAKLYPQRRSALLFHLPIAVFMALYTWFGLWLLAAPKGA